MLPSREGSSGPTHSSRSSAPSDVDQAQKHPEQDLSTIHGNFIELPAIQTSSPQSSSTPPTTSVVSSTCTRRSSPSKLGRLRSPSPRRRQIDSPVHLHLSLTDSQMDKLTSAFGSNGTPKRKPRQRDDRKSREGHGMSLRAAAYPSSPNPISPKVGNQDPSKRTPPMGTTDEPRGRALPQHITPQVTERSSSPAKRSQSPNKGREYSRRSYDERPVNPADRRGSPRPSPIDVELARKQRTPARGVHTPVAAIHDEFGTTREVPDFPFPAQTPSRRITVEGNRMPAVSDTSSVYSDGDREGPCAAVSPLRISKTVDHPSTGRDHAPPQSNILRDYSHWRVSALSSLSHASARGTSTSSPPRTSGNTHEVSSLSSDVSEEGGADGPSIFSSAAVPSAANPAARDVFSPFPQYNKDNDTSAERKGRKIMIGHNGWLEHTGVTKHIDLRKPSPPKKAGGFLDALKKKAKEVVDMTENKVNRRAKDAERDRRTSRLRISLDPREQSLLYCEMEFLLTSALDDYLHSQFSAGRLEVDKYKKVVDHWQQQGRPKVVGFRYDLETQLNLVHLHLNQFKFYGDRSGAPVALGGVLDMMKVNSRAIRIRTFCQPDSVIAKQLLDSQSLLDVLGSPESRQIQLAEIIQFFKIALERARNLNTSTSGARSSMPPPPLPVAGRGQGQCDGVYNTPQSSPRT